ncbi:hypothetical protein MATL_G00176970 [Megalops atlanticus]|uniref:E3 ubiquitin ligase TRAF3IP2 n=1 Tax=Megalops atlanticus TaxID=7932 RepID=A0A9D3PQU4_MEGAT|nr:hypothetical protein MATL_G00176970 [Megalops atlanticus]
MMKYAAVVSESLNCPEENDETLSEDFAPSAPFSMRSSPRPESLSPRSRSPVSCPSGMAEQRLYRCDPARPSYPPYQPPLGLPSGYSPPTPFPSQAEGCLSCPDARKSSGPYPSFASSFYGRGYPNSMPFCVAPSEYPSFLSQDCYHQTKLSSLGPSCSSLEQPRSLHSFPPNYFMPPPYLCTPQGPGCCTQCPAEGHRMGPSPHHYVRPGHHVPYGPPGPDHCGCSDTGSAQSEYPHPHLRPNTTPCKAPLSLQHRKVFVTYEADSDKHVNEIIKFVALLRHNGFDMRIDVFEQQFRSISKIDFMEQFINEKDYLIIIVISPKYYETVTAASISRDNDERTLNTVYIHKQLQNEFIQNGCRNFRFIPILFPGAKKCHVPAWLQNTHVHSWPKDRDDILRRLMRVEKYNPPPIGDLPTIVSIPL